MFYDTGLNFRVKLRVYAAFGLNYILDILDIILSWLGLGRIYEASLDNVLKNLPPDMLNEEMQTDFADFLSIYTSCLQKCKKLSSYTVFTQIITLRRLLEQRDNIRQAIKANPSISCAPIRRPIFVIGLPRTGTSLLTQLLEIDPQFRAPLLWEIFQPTPAGRAEDWKSSKKYRDGKQQVLITKQISCSLIDKAHEMHPDLPEECYMLLMRSGLHTHPFVTLSDFEALAEWYYSLTADQAKVAYELHKQQLQVISHGMAGQTWVLKAHVHLMHLDTIMDVYPDACFIVTHRRLTEVVPSFCSMEQKAVSLWQPDAGYGQRVVRYLSQLANRSAHVMARYRACQPVALNASPPQRRSGGDSLGATGTRDRQPFHYLAYGDLVKDPIGVIRDIYEHFDFKLSPTVEDEMRGWLKKYPKNKHGTHEYSMEQFGLTEEDLRTNFVDYLDFFKEMADLV